MDARPEYSDAGHAGLWQGCGRAVGMQGCLASIRHSALPHSDTLRCHSLPRSLPLYLCVLFFLAISLSLARARTDAGGARKAGEGQERAGRKHARLLAPAAKTQNNVIAHTVCGCGDLDRSAESFFMCTRPTATPSSMSSTLDVSLYICT